MSQQFERRLHQLDWCHNFQSVREPPTAAWDLESVSVVRAKRMVMVLRLLFEQVEPIELVEWVEPVESVELDEKEGVCTLAAPQDEGNRRVAV